MPHARIQSAPVRNPSVVGAHVYSHSGEFAPQVTDLTLPGRGISFAFVRKYRSACHDDRGVLGRGWSFAYAKRLVAADGGVLYEDGFGRTHHFRSTRGGFEAPDGFYARLDKRGGRLLLTQRLGDTLAFAPPDRGGRLAAVADRHGNSLTFSYAPDAVTITDVFRRKVLLALDDAARIVRCRDHLGRTWDYGYDANDCLVEVAQPAPGAGEERPTTRYGYDDRHRLISITDPKGQSFLHNVYDDDGRVVQQHHGRGRVSLSYRMVSAPSGAEVVLTAAVLKNGARLELLHDAEGHCVQQTVLVSGRWANPTAERPSDMVKLTTSSRFNRHGELVERSFPAGDRTLQVFDEDNADARARGNLLEVTRRPAAGASADQASLRTVYTFEPRWQQLASATDPKGHTVSWKYDRRGNLSSLVYPPTTGVASDGRSVVRTTMVERFKYNASGQLVWRTDARGARTEYSYHPVGRPGGKPGRVPSRGLTQGAGGYLARVVVDVDYLRRPLKTAPARVARGYTYDAAGHVVETFDARGARTRYRRDALGRTVGIEPPDATAGRVTVRYDANGNVTERTRTWRGRPGSATAEGRIRELLAYSELNNVVSRTLDAGDARKIETLVRDAAEHVVRRVAPDGRAVEFAYDERGLLCETREPGSAGERRTVRTYDPNGELSAVIDPLGARTEFVLDGYGRRAATIAPDGSATRRWFDPLGHAIRVTVGGVGADEAPILDTSFEHDEIGRLTRVDRAWRDPETGEPLGDSFDGRRGIVSQVVRYDGGYKPAAAWSESGNVLSFDYDGAGRLVSATDDSGDTLDFEFDSAGNTRRIRRRAARASRHDRPLEILVEQKFDAMNRVVEAAVPGGPTIRYQYDGRGLVTKVAEASGRITTIGRDGFGRPVERVRPLAADAGGSSELRERLVWDAADRLVAWTDPSGRTTRYTYDGAGLLSGVVLANGRVHVARRDAAGNVVSSVDPNGLQIDNTFDANGRLAARHTEDVAGRREIARFDYDTAGRCVRAAAGDATVERRYDSLSRLLAETQNGRTLHYVRDAAGRVLALRYPGGLEVQRRFDAAGRLVEVSDAGGSILTCTYASASHLASRQLGGLLDVSLSYDAAHQRFSAVTYSSPAHGLVFDGRYVYDAAGRLVRVRHVTSTATAVERYSYDAVGRLRRAASAAVPGTSSRPLALDEVIDYERTPTGRWRAMTVRSGATVTTRRARFDDLDRFTGDGARRFVLDANGNRVAAEESSGARIRSVYDPWNRLTTWERTTGAASEAVRYSYDVFGRVLGRQVTQGERTSDHAYTWDGDSLLEHWENGRLAHSFVHGAGVDPLKFYRHTMTGDETYFFVRDGKGDIGGLFHAHRGLVEQYRYGADGYPVAGLGSVVDSAAGNPFRAGGHVWDAELGMYSLHGRTWDAFTGDFLDIGQGLVDMRPPGPPQKPVDPILVGLEMFVGFGLFGVGLAVDAVGVIFFPGGWFFTPPAWISTGLMVIGGALVFDAVSGSPGLSWVLDKLGLGGGPAGAATPGSSGWGGGSGYGGSSGAGSSGYGSGSSGTGSSGSGSSGSSGGWGAPGGGGPGDRPSKDDFGSSGDSGGGPPSSGAPDGAPGGGQPGPPSGGTGGGPSQGTSTQDTSSGKTHTPVLNDQGEWVYDDTGEPVSDDDKKDKGTGGGSGSGSMPNPVDGTGEGIDRDWWRGLPSRSAFDIAAEMKYGPKQRDPESGPTFNYAGAGSGYLNSVLFPSPVTVDERGEGVHINLAGVRGDPSATGTSTTDGWGDKPRSWAEALAAPRIRDATRSRF